ncbi:AsnC family transcriptional regulator [Candidatus Woesearchaeota archaeon]|nr:AsnC family transcriptional regulator [Candidatus Woesearchaeota archaeon]
MQEKKSFVGQIYDLPQREKLDNLDKEILYLLSINSRFSLSYIGKKLNVSREVVYYRIENLKQKKILNGFFTIIDSNKINLKITLLCIKIRKFDNFNNVIEELVKIKEINRVQACGGRWDLRVFITHKNNDEFENIFNKLMKTYGDLIHDYVVLSIEKEKYLGLKLLVDRKDSFKKQNYRINKSSFYKELNVEISESGFDETDLKILEILQHNARINIKEIGDKINYSRTAVENRLKKLTKSKIIKGFIPMISLSFLGFQWHKILFKIKNIDEKKFLSYMKTLRCVPWYMKFKGDWNYQISVFSKNNAHFYNILNSIRTKFSEEIITCDSLVVFNQYKFDINLTQV